jgi:hypothetical protein
VDVYGVYSGSHRIPLSDVEKKKEELENQQYSKDDLLADHQLGKLTLRTVYKWMERLGFRYQPRMKCYYLDGHEKPEVPLQLC